MIGRFEAAVIKMNEPHQHDLFETQQQSELFEAGDTPVYRANPDEVRAQLYRILNEARAAEVVPWEPRKTALYQTIFPQMANCLPEEEGAQLRFEFENELIRLKAA